MWGADSLVRVIACTGAEPSRRYWSPRSRDAPAARARIGWTCTGVEPDLNRTARSCRRVARALCPRAVPRPPLAGDRRRLDRDDLLVHDSRREAPERHDRHHRLGAEADRLRPG